MRQFIGSFISLIIFSILLSNCVAPDQQVETHTTSHQFKIYPEVQKTKSVDSPKHDVHKPPHGISVKGKRLECKVIGSGDDTILVLGGIHGSEPAGETLARELISYLSAKPSALIGKRIVVAPAINPDGLAKGRRRNSNGVDINRNFATSNRTSLKRHGKTPLSEPEARFISNLIDFYKPKVIVSIHQPINCIDWDGPAKDLAKAMSEACSMPVKKIGALPGSLGSYAGIELGIPIITVELPGSATRISPKEVWRKFGKMMLVAIRYDLDSKQ